ncbi:MAG: rod shape-determining protein MreC [Succinivibrio sp.]|nr:rod shape-determining protein MreC [Succinivibrio sp.]
MTTAERGKNYLIHIRFAVIAVICVALMAVDVRSKALSDFRYYLETALYPILAFADSPHKITKIVSNHLKSNNELMEENERLSAENYMQRADILRLKSLESENEAMRKLLNSPMHRTSKRLFAEVVDVGSDIYQRRVVINRGSGSGVYVGMPVISDTGLVGQVISVNYAFSRVLLLSDPNSSIPVVNARNNIRAIANGDGSADELLISNVPRSSDFKAGDKLLTSGLGGVFPEGYPVATVTSVGFSESQPFAFIKAKPMVDTARMRYVLLLWYQRSDYEDPDDKVLARERTDGKVILRQKRIKALIDSMSREQAHLNSASLPEDLPPQVRAQIIEGMNHDGKTSSEAGGPR